VFFAVLELESYLPNHSFLVDGLVPYEFFYFGAERCAPREVELGHSCCHMLKSCKRDKRRFVAVDHGVLEKRNLKYELTEDPHHLRSLHEVAEHFVKPEGRWVLHVEVKHFQDVSFKELHVCLDNNFRQSKLA